MTPVRGPANLQPYKLPNLRVCNQADLSVLMFEHFPELFRSCTTTISDIFVFGKLFGFGSLKEEYTYIKWLINCVLILTCQWQRQKGIQPSWKKFVNLHINLRVIGFLTGQLYLNPCANLNGIRDWYDRLYMCSIELFCYNFRKIFVYRSIHKLMHKFVYIIFTNEF